ncbi:hypothetical protein D3C75_439620 [compost metagenome]
MSDMNFIVADNYFAIEVPSAIEATEAKRQEFIRMMEELYAIGYMSVVSMDFQVKDRGKKLYTILYLHVSITGVSFQLKVTLLNATNTLNAMLRYSHSQNAKHTVNDHIRTLIVASKEQKSEK